MQVIVLEEGAIPMNLVFAGYFCITVYSTTQKRRLLTREALLNFRRIVNVMTKCVVSANTNCVTQIARRSREKKQFKSNTTDKQNLIKLGKRIQFRQRTECAYAYVGRSFFILRIDLIRSISPFPLASS